MPTTNRKSTTPEGSIELARRINNAIISYQLGISYQTAEKKYGGDVDPNPSFVEACWQMYRAKIEGVSDALVCGKQIEQSTEGELQGTLRAFIDLLHDKRHVHCSRSFTDDPKFPGVFISLVSCPDDMADRLKAKMDEIVPAEFAEEGVKEVQVKVQ